MTDILAECFPRMADVTPRWQKPVPAPAPCTLDPRMYDAWKASMPDPTPLTLEKINAWWKRYSEQGMDRAP